MHWSLDNKYQMERKEKWDEHSSEGVLENGNIKILWDINIKFDHTTVAKRHEIIVLNRGVSKTLSNI